MPTLDCIPDTEHVVCTPRLLIWLSGHLIKRTVTCQIERGSIQVFSG